MSIAPVIELSDSVSKRPVSRPRSDANFQSHIWLTLQTRQAQLLVRGRKVKGKPNITGLVGFADRLRLIWYAAQANDPYADWWLIKIHDGLVRAKDAVGEQRVPIRELLDSVTAFEVAPSSSKDPFRIQLHFSSPYAYLAAQVLSQFDEFVREALTARHIGLIKPREASADIFKCGSRLRGLFNIPTRFRRTGVDRSDDSSWNGNGEMARRFMGEVPPDILDGTRRAELAPEINPAFKTFVPAVLDPFLDDEGFDI